MELDAHLLVAAVHRQALIRLSQIAGKKFQGLDMAGKALLLSPNWRRKLRNLDATLGLVEKITPESNARWLQDLELELQRVGAVSGASSSDTLPMVPPPPANFVETLPPPPPPPLPTCTCCGLFICVGGGAGAATGAVQSPWETPSQGTFDQGDSSKYNEVGGTPHSSESWRVVSGTPHSSESIGCVFHSIASEDGVSSCSDLGDVPFDEYDLLFQSLAMRFANVAFHSCDDSEDDYTAGCAMTLESDKSFADTSSLNFTCVPFFSFSEEDCKEAFGRRIVVQEEGFKEEEEAKEKETDTAKNSGDLGDVAAVVGSVAIFSASREGTFESDGPAGVADEDSEAAHTEEDEPTSSAGIGDLGGSSIYSEENKFLARFDDIDELEKNLEDLKWAARTAIEMIRDGESKWQPVADQTLARVKALKALRERGHFPCQYIVDMNDVVRY